MPNDSDPILPTAAAVAPSPAPAAKATGKTDATKAADAETPKGGSAKSPDAKAKADADAKAKEAAKAPQTTSVNGDDAKGDRYVSYMRVAIGEKVFDSINGDWLANPEPYVLNSSTQHNEFWGVLNDPDGTLMGSINKADSVSVEVGFVDGPREGIFTGKLYEIGRSLPNGTIIVAVDESYDLGNQITSGITPNSTGSTSGAIGGNPSDANFDRILKFVQRFEGDGAAGAADLGGKTRFGVTIELWTSLGKPEPQTKEAAAAIFKEIYWDGGPRCGQYKDPIASVCFDTCVNFGANGDGTKSQGWKSLSSGTDVTNDPVGAARTVIQRRLQWREARAARNPSQKAFVKGWQRRDNELGALVEEIAKAAPPAAAPGGTPAENPTDKPAANSQQDTLQKSKAATDSRTDGKPAPPQSVQKVTEAKGAVNLQASNRSVVDTGGSGKVQAEQSALESATTEAQTKGDAIAVRGNTLEQVSAGNEKDSGVVINYATARDLFIGEPRIIQRTGLQLKSGFGALTVAGFSVSGKESVGATVVTSGGTPTGPSGPIMVPEVGSIKASDLIYPGSLYTWGDATKNMTRPPGKGDSARSPKQVAENIIKIAIEVDKLSQRFKGGQKLQISSWYRDPASNAATPGAAKGSRHIHGDAVDITDSLFPKIHADLTKEGWNGGLAISPGSFCHVDLGDKRTWKYG